MPDDLLNRLTALERRLRAGFTTARLVVTGLATLGQLTVTGALTADSINVGSASGASAGQIRASGTLRLGGITNGGVKQATYSLADDATTQLFATNDRGWAFVYDNGNAAAIYQINGDSNSVSEISDTATAYATTNTDGLTSIEATGAGVYTLRNRRGGARVYTATLIGQF